MNATHPTYECAERTGNGGDTASRGAHRPATCAPGAGRSRGARGRMAGIGASHLAGGRRLQAGPLASFFCSRIGRA